MWIPGPSSELLKQNVARVGELSLAFFFFKLSVCHYWEWVGAALCCRTWASQCGGFSRGRADSVAVAHLLASWNVGFSWIRDWMHCSLRWQADCCPLRHQGSPACVFKTTQKQGWHRMWWWGMFFVALTTLNWSQQPSATNWDLSHPGRVRAP